MKVLLSVQSNNYKKFKKKLNNSSSRTVFKSRTLKLKQLSRAVFHPRLHVNDQCLAILSSPSRKTYLCWPSQGNFFFFNAFSFITARTVRTSRQGDRLLRLLCSRSCYMRSAIKKNTGSDLGYHKWL